MVSLLLAVVLATLAVKCANRTDTVPTFVSAAYFGFCAVSNMIMTPRLAVSLYVAMAVAYFSLIIYIFVSDSGRNLSKLSFVVLIILCAESLWMADDELKSSLVSTLIYALDPFIQLAADAVFIAVGAISVIRRSDHDYT